MAGDEDWLTQAPVVHEQALKHDLQSLVLSYCEPTEAEQGIRVLPNPTVSELR